MSETKLFPAFAQMATIMLGCMIPVAIFATLMNRRDVSWTEETFGRSR